MTPINKLSGNICTTCRTIITQTKGDQILCNKCQEESLYLLSKVVRFMNLVPNGKYGSHYKLCGKISKFIREVDYD